MVAKWKKWFEQGKDYVTNVYDTNGFLRERHYGNGDRIGYFKSGKIEYMRKRMGYFKEGFYKNGQRKYLIDYFNSIRKGWRKNGIVVCYLGLYNCTTRNNWLLN